MAADARAVRPYFINRLSEATDHFASNTWTEVRGLDMITARRAVIMLQKSEHKTENLSYILTYLPVIFLYLFSVGANRYEWLAKQCWNQCDSNHAQECDA